MPTRPPRLFTRLLTPPRGLKLALAGALVASIALPALTHPVYESAVAGRQSAGTRGERAGTAPVLATTPQRGRHKTAPLVAVTRPRWKRHLDRLVAHKNIGVAVSLDGRRLYYHRARKMRRPASNQKLLLSMALLERFGPHHRIQTRARSAPLDGGVVRGNLWVTGRGDPTLSSDARHARAMLVRPTYVGRLAQAIATAGIDEIEGRVMGGTGYFKHDWDAPGWRSYYRAYYVGLPTALTLNGNIARRRYIRNPEKRLARALTERLERLGVRVGGRPGAGAAPTGLTPVAKVSSAPLAKLMTQMNVTSSNFFAEILGKALGAAVRGPRGSIAKGARVLESYAYGAGVRVTAHDSSGLSHADRMSSRGLIRLLQDAATKPWFPALRHSLASPGRGTLENRLEGVRVKAKTGTLIDVSALSGWVWLRREQAWAEFSIISGDMPKYRAVALEDAIVRKLAGHAA
ncbi:MAG: D-alanyl-D-alanine carboxypeptidase [Actinomycetota bacterium]|nr:D-alanyl-D-alanine carboxypeptidase [Actinomycetota bacterium]